MFFSAKLGSFVGEYSYVCEDTEPRTEQLYQRVRRLIQRSNAWGGLRRQLVELQDLLAESAGNYMVHILILVSYSTYQNERVYL